MVLAFAGMLAVSGGLSLPAALLAYQLAALLLATAARLFSAVEQIEFARFNIDLASEMLDLPQEGGGDERANLLMAAPHATSRHCVTPRS